MTLPPRNDADAHIRPVRALADLFRGYGARVMPERLSALALAFLNHAALIGEEMAGTEKPGRIAQNVRREAKRLLRLSDDALLEGVRGASDDLRAEYAGRAHPFGEPVSVAREALEFIADGSQGERAPDDPRGEPWALKGRPELPGLDDLADDLAAIFSELTGKPPTDSRPSDWQETGGEFYNFCLAVDDLAVAPPGLAESSRHRRTARRWKLESETRDAAEGAREAAISAIADDGRAVLASIPGEPKA